MRLPLNRGTIVLVDLSDTVGCEKRNGEGNRYRPAIVVQNDRGNDVSSTTIIVPLTDAKQYKPHLPVQVFVKADELHFEKSKDSVAECGQVRTIDRDRRITRVLGKVDENCLTRIDRALMISLGLATTLESQAAA